jgi:hypothetical protein
MVILSSAAQAALPRRLVLTYVDRAAPGKESRHNTRGRTLEEIHGSHTAPRVAARV